MAMTPEEENEIVRNLRKAMPSLDEATIRKTLKDCAALDLTVENFPQIMQALMANIRKPK